MGRGWGLGPGETRRAAPMWTATLALWNIQVQGVAERLMAAEFDAAWRASYMDQLRALLPGKCRDGLELLPFTETLEALGHAGEEEVGRRDVPLDAIVGSVGRVGDFDHKMRPRQAHLRERWEALAQAQRDLPPVRLLQLGELYFIEDGHHRVSIARARRFPSVRASVRRICTTVCVTRHLTLADLPAKAAERVFLERVPLPDDVRLTLKLDCPSDWRAAAEAAEAWGFRQSLAGRTISDRCELATAWWEHEVAPVVRELRGRGIYVSGADLDDYLRHRPESPTLGPDELSPLSG